MPTSLNKYLDRPALDETVVNIRQIVEALEEEMQDLPYARPDGLYPDMTVGAVVGADETAQWTQRESTGSGAATVRSVQGAAEVQDGELVPVTIAGIASTDAQGGELDSVEWETQTLRAAGSVADMLYSDHVDVRVGVVDLGTLDWTYTDNYVRFSATLAQIGTLAAALNWTCPPYTTSMAAYYDSNRQDMVITINQSSVFVRNNAYTDAATFKAAMSGVYLFYELATPTTTPISPALPMTYRVEQGGSEAIIVPAGEISAAPVLTVAEPVNAGDEFSRIWAAIQSLGYTRNTAQLSRPVSLTDIGSIDEVQNDTTEIDTTKEVTE